jgi:hypothetical protein
MYYLYLIASNYGKLLNEESVEEQRSTLITSSLIIIIISSTEFVDIAVEVSATINGNATTPTKYKGEFVRSQEVT